MHLEITVTHVEQQVDETGKIKWKTAYIRTHLISYGHKCCNIISDDIIIEEAKMAAARLIIQSFPLTPKKE